MIHYKWSQDRSYQVLFNVNNDVDTSYGVSSKPRILNIKLMQRHYDRIVIFLRDILGLSPFQVAVAVKLLRFYAYYGRVYPRQSDIQEGHIVSKATFWRTIEKLEGLGLLKRIPRYFIREKAQTSNLYEMEKLLIVLARYLREHGVALADSCVKVILKLGGAEFWSWAFNRKYSALLPGLGAP